MPLPTPKRVTGLLDFVKNLNNKRLNKKFDKAEEEARKQGVNVLGLDIDNTATDRALAMKEYGLDYNKTLKRPLYHGTASKFDEVTLPHEWAEFYTSQKKPYAKFYAEHMRGGGKNAHVKELVAPKEKTSTTLYHRKDVGHNPYRHMRVFEKPEAKYLRYKPYVKGGSRKQVSHFNPKMLGLGGAGATVSGSLSAEEMPSSDQDLSRFAPKPQHEFRQAPSSLLDKAADAYQWTADEGGWLGEFLYSPGARALRHLGNETTPMVKTGRLKVPTGEALLDLMGIFQL